jgi:hypothetical protein
LTGFRPRKLWLSSANFTRSRNSLDFGHWTDEPAHLQHARDFLVRLIARSEDLLDAEDEIKPQFLPVELDDEAFAEYAAGRDFDEADEDDDEDDD